MRTIVVGICIGIMLLGLYAGTAEVFAQRDGFLSATTVDLQTMLPPEAVYEGTHVVHKITSTTENLHLLAGYYFGNTRLWKSIYQANRTVIKNPNRLPVGKTIRIEVGENWKPKFSYTEWLELATRNGEWKPGVPWQRASQSPSPAQDDSSASTATPTSQAIPPAPAAKQPEGTPTALPASESTPRPPAL